MMIGSERLSSCENSLGYDIGALPTRLPTLQNTRGALRFSMIKSQNAGANFQTMPAGLGEEGCENARRCNGL